MPQENPLTVLAESIDSLSAHSVTFRAEKRSLALHN
jgi:hypothetical protein